MLNWKEIDTVLLDMDGTLLDLRFDNHFWKEYVPFKYAEKHNLPLEIAKDHLVPRFKSKEGTLEWYCLDYWTETLQLDIAALKVELSDLIAVLPHVTEFLTKLQETHHHVLLVTNAHRSSLSLKMEKTGLAVFFDAIVSSHDFGKPKENTGFWECLKQAYYFDQAKTLLIDDSAAVLNSAQNYGIRHLVSINRPDSSMPKRDVNNFTAIEDFRELMPGL
ncbi:MAG: GMP/IMP nucleotidase [Methylococcaceae bacterium]|nr:GMP/IMP nucleotidase [Methylococcaceae bacterium]